MKSLDLTLRQKKLLHTMQHSASPRTGLELAETLGVSSRTIRNDVVKINEELAPYGASIAALKSKGYVFQSSDPQLIESLNQIENAFFSKENRIRYLAFRLCLSDEPLNLYDLEDEMFISHTTLEHALRGMTDLYSQNYPFIKLNRKRDFISFEEDELKRRAVLNQLLRESWNYHARSNAYYKDDFIEDDVLDFIIDTVSLTLDRYHIAMEDPCIVSLNLTLAIMYYRILSDHFLSYAAPVPKLDPILYQATNDILDAMEHELEFFIGPEERDAIYLQLKSLKYMAPNEFILLDYSDFFGPVTIGTCDEYIRRIKEVFHIDFSRDEDFYVSLLQYVQSILQEQNTFFEQFSTDLVKRYHRISMVIAYLFQPLAVKQLGRELNEVKLIYLSFIIAGGLDYYIKHHPGHRIRTVIACHMNMPVSWAMMRRAQYFYGDALDIMDLIPVYKKNSYDFSNVDLVLTTVQKQITTHPGTTTLYITPFFDDKDHDLINNYIMNETLRPLYSREMSLLSLLRQAWWHENENFQSPEELLTRTTQQFIDTGVADQAYQDDILRHEERSTYAVFPGIVLVYSLVPTGRSQLSITTLEHRLTWNSHKVRIVVTAALTEEDMPALLQLTNFLYEDAYDYDVIKNLKTKEEILAYVRNSHMLQIRRPVSTDA